MKRHFGLYGTLLALALLISCGDAGTAAAETTAAQKKDTVPVTTADAGAEAETEAIKEYVEAIDCGGEEITFLTYQNSTYQNSVMDVKADSENGEHINDAVYTRNGMLCDKYNITVRAEGDENSGSAVSTAKNTVLSGDGSYDVFLLSTEGAMGLGIDGHLLDMNTMPHINTKNGWWNDGLREKTSILGTSYFLIGDMNIDTWTQSYVIYFNKKLAEDYDLPDLYGTVRDNKWTFAELDRMTRLVYNDVNGNGAYDENDLYGFTACSVCIDCFWASSGVQFVAKDGRDAPVLAISDNFYEMYDDMVSLLEAPEMLYTDRPQYTAYRDTYDRGAFMEDRALFFLEGLCVADNKLRDMKTDYGILPIPKYEETQEHYYVYSHMGHNSTVSVPVTEAENTDKLSRILEDMAYYSSLTVRPAYYDKMLEGKLARSEEDIEMLEIITTSVTYDLGVLLIPDFKAGGGLRGAVSNADPAASFIEKRQKSYEKQLEKVIAAVEENLANT